MKVYTALPAGEQVTQEVAIRVNDAAQLWYDDLADALCEGRAPMVSAKSAAKIINILCTAGRSAEQGGVPLPLA